MQQEQRVPPPLPERENDSCRWDAGRTQGMCHPEDQLQDRDISTFCEDSFNFCDNAVDSSSNGEPGFCSISLQHIA